MKARIEKDGAILEVEGTAEECAEAIRAFMAASATPRPFRDPMLEPIGPGLWLHDATGLTVGDPHVMCSGCSGGCAGCRERSSVVPPSTTDVPSDDGARRVGTDRTTGHAAARLIPSMPRMHKARTS